MLVFGAIDHCVEYVVGWHVAKVGDRWAALEPIRQGVRQTHGGYAPKIALGPGVAHGPRAAVHGAPVPGGVALARDPAHAELCGRAREQRDHGALDPDAEGRMLYLHDFATLEEARQVISEFVERYNRAWLLERHSYRTPAEVRRPVTRQAA